MSGSVLTPRVRVLSNGVALPTPLSASVTTNSYYHASEFSLEFAASAQAGAWWDVSPPWVLDVEFSTDGATFTTLISGEVDNLDFDAAAHTLSLTGRDFVAVLIESKTQETFQNKTASEIVQIIAARHNLIASVAPTSTVASQAYPQEYVSVPTQNPQAQKDAALLEALWVAQATGLTSSDGSPQSPSVAQTTALAGTFYQQDHTRITLGQFSRAQTEWDLLTYLAQHEGFDLWVQGRTIYFQPQQTQTKPDFTVAVLTGADGMTVGNVERLQLSRALTLAKDIQVDVRSWNSRQHRGFTKSVRAIGAKVAAIQPASNQVGTTTQRYVFVRPNLTEDQALQFAQTMAEQLGRHERNVEFDMPGELVLSARSQIAVTGTGTSFDQSYWVDSIHRQIAMGGFRQSVRVKNHSPLSQVALS